MRIGPGEGTVQTKSMGQDIHDTPGVPDVHSEFTLGGLAWRWAAVLFCIGFWIVMIRIFLKSAV